MVLVVGLVKLLLVQYCEMVVFVQFGFDFDVVIQQLLVCGVCLIELMKQFQYLLLINLEIVCIIYVGINGYFDNVEVKDIVCYEVELLIYLCIKKVDFLQWIIDEDLKFKKGELVEKMKVVLDEFVVDFV